MGRRAILVVFLLLLAACGGSRPAVPTWTSQWDTVRASLPTEQPLEQSTCERAITQLRKARVGLMPTPTDQLDGAVDAWILEAERIYFECPPPEGFDEAFRRLDRLASEVDALLGR